MEMYDTEVINYSNDAKIYSPKIIPNFDDNTIELSSDSKIIRKTILKFKSPTEE